MSLIGISGKISSGKDTVGILIQHLVAQSKGMGVHDYQLQKRLPGNISETFSLVEYLQTIPQSLTIQSGWEIKKYAGKLKQIASLLTGVPVHKFEDQEFKNSFMPPEWDWMHGFESPATGIRKEVHAEMEDRRKRYTYREFLQRIGTEAMRHQMHEEIWINALFADYKPSGVKMVNKKDPSPDDAVETAPNFPNWIITDVRFPNEASAIRKRDGIIIRVNRPITTIKHADGATTHLVDHPPFREEHPSETSLDKYKFDYVIQNDGTIEDLVKNVRTILTTEKIL